MTRLAALRTSVILIFATLFFGTVGLAGHSPLAEAVFLITGSLGALMVFFGFAAPTAAPIPVRVRGPRNRRWSSVKKCGSGGLRG